MRCRLLPLAGALALAACGAQLREVPAALDPSNPDAPEGAPAPLPRFAEQSQEYPTQGASVGDMPGMQPRDTKAPSAMT